MKPLPAPLPLEVTEGSIETRATGLTKLLTALFAALGDPFDVEKGSLQFHTQGASERYEETQRWVSGNRAVSLRFLSSAAGDAAAGSAAAHLTATVTGLPGDVQLRLEGEKGEYELSGPEAAAAKVEAAFTKLLH